MEQFCNRYQKLIKGENGGFLAEYNVARSLSETHPSYLTRFTKVTSEVARRNRYSNVLTFEDTRVKLLSLKPGDCDYVNASFVRYGDGPKTIVAQGPMKNTAEHFWRMCCEQDVPLIIMLTDFEEEQTLGFMREKCFRYFALEVGQKVQFGAFTITCLSISEVCPGWTERTLQLSMPSRSIVREVHHVHCYNWTDFGALCEDQLEGLRRSLQVVQSVRASAERGPIAVHCSAGIGRSGTFVAIDNILHHAQAGKWDAVDPLKVVSTLRDQRPLMVQTPDQYRMIYEASLFFLGCDVYKEIQGMDKGVAQEENFVDQKE